MNVAVAIAIIRFAALALAALAADWILYQASQVGSGSARLTFALLRVALPLLAPMIVLARWKYSLLTIVVARCGFVAIETRAQITRAALEVAGVPEGSILTNWPMLNGLIMQGMGWQVNPNTIPAAGAKG